MVEKERKIANEILLLSDEKKREREKKKEKKVETKCQHHSTNRTSR